MKVTYKETKETFEAFQWDGITVPLPEYFEDLGYFENENGYDLECVDTDFEIEKGRENKAYVRLNDWILKNAESKFTNVSEKFFIENFTK
jgi:hypothetical protein